MSMNLAVAQQRIIRGLNEAESALNDALIKQTALFLTMITARKETNSNPFLGHESLLRVSKSQQSLLAAGSDLARAHNGLLNTQAEVMGIDACPENLPMQPSGLHVEAA